MSPVDLSRLSPPQIAQAVATGGLAIEAAEAELRRRPSEPSAPRRSASRHSPSCRSPSAPPAQEQLRRTLEATRRELRRATRHLAQIAERLDALHRIAPPDRAAGAPVDSAPSAPATLRSTRILLDPRPEGIDDLLDEEAA